MSHVDELDYQAINKRTNQLLQVGHQGFIVVKAVVQEAKVRVEPVSA